MKNKTALLFLIFALLALLLGMLFGLLSGLQYLLPDFMKQTIPFNRLRPLHVTSVLSWIILGATGGIYYYLFAFEKATGFGRHRKLHLVIFVLTGLMIYGCYLTGTMGGKEYLEFPPVLMLPILLGWGLFGRYFFGSLVGKVNRWPVYYWMWGTGIVFMIYHLCESYLWMLPWFGKHFIKCIEVQWKSGGSYVGSWNMLVYGTAIFLMSKIEGDDHIGRTRLSFFFYFLGLTNLMFGWAHHIYIVPTAAWVRYLSYGISMTEWVILFHMIYTWRKSLPATILNSHPLALRFLAATDIWIFLNLILALVFSIPAINLFTHGTHITVAHSMGSTIGINTTILMASVVFIVSRTDPGFKSDNPGLIWGYRIFNVSLFLFWLSLLIAGMKRSNWMYFGQKISFATMQHHLYGCYVVFLLSGIGIFIGLYLVILPLLQSLIKTVWKRRP